MAETKVTTAKVRNEEVMWIERRFGKASRFDAYENGSYSPDGWRLSVCKHGHEWHWSFWSAAYQLVDSRLVKSAEYARFESRCRLLNWIDSQAKQAKTKGVQV